MIMSKICRRSMRKLYISYELIATHIKDQKALDAIALCVMVKRMFVSSTIKGATVRRLKQMLGMGQTKLQKVLRTAERLELIEWTDGNTLFVRPLKQTGAFNFTYTFEHDSKLGMEQIRTSVTIKDVVLFLRREYMKNKVHQQQSNVDAHASYVSPSNKKELIRAKRICKSRNLTAAYRTLSNDKISQSLGISKRKVRELMHSLVADGSMMRTPVFKRLPILRSEINQNVATYCREELHMRGYLFVSHRYMSVVQRFADCYRLNCDAPLCYLHENR